MRICAPAPADALPAALTTWFSRSAEAVASSRAAAPSSPAPATASRRADQEVSGTVAPVARSVAPCRYLFEVASASDAIPSRPRSGAESGLSAKARRKASAADVPASAEAPANGLAISPRLIAPIAPKAVSMPTAASASRMRPVKASSPRAQRFAAAAMPPAWCWQTACR